MWFESNRGRDLFGVEYAWQLLRLKPDLFHFFALLDEQARYKCSTITESCERSPSKHRNDILECSLVGLFGLLTAIMMSTGATSGESALDTCWQVTLDL
jgi:hypothetical protein